MVDLKYGDCLELMKCIANKSIDLVLIDPPYNIKKAKWDYWKTVDEYLEFMFKVFIEIQRVLKDNGSFYFFHNDINQVVDLLYWIKNNTNLVLKNQIIWSKFNNWKNANIKDGAGIYRSILQCYGNQRSYNNSTTEYIFYLTKDEIDNFSFLMNYFKMERLKLGWTYKQCDDYLGIKTSYCYWDKPTTHEYRIPKKEYYLKLQKTGYYHIPYSEIEKIYNNSRYKFNQKNVTFKGIGIDNIKKILKPYTTVWENERDDIYFKYNHLTPKPIKMLEHIIKTSSNENDIVLDCFMGSGSTGVACKHLNRNFIGIESDKNYFEIAKKRIKEE